MTKASYLVDAFRIDVGGFFFFCFLLMVIEWFFVLNGYWMEVPALLGCLMAFFFLILLVHTSWFQPIKFFQSEMITYETLAKSLQITFIITLFLLYIKMQLCAFSNTISEKIHTHLMKLRDYALKYCDF